MIMAEEEVVGELDHMRRSVGPSWAKKTSHFELWGLPTLRESAVAQKSYVGLQDKIHQVVKVTQP